MANGEGRGKRAIVGRSTMGSQVYEPKVSGVYHRIRTAQLTSLFPVCFS
jgi:hypothetical protein